MARKGFDPFDERHRDKVKRRKPAEIAYDKRCWEERVDNHFRKALDRLNWPDYVASDTLFQELSFVDWNLPPTSLKRHFPAALERLGYVKSVNKNSKDGRWSFQHLNFFMYKKRNLPDVEKHELKQALGMI